MERETWNLFFNCFAFTLLYLLYLLYITGRADIRVPSPRDLWESGPVLYPKTIDIPPLPTPTTLLRVKGIRYLPPLVVHQARTGEGEKKNPSLVKIFTLIFLYLFFLTPESSVAPPAP